MLVSLFLVLRYEACKKSDYEKWIEEILPRGGVVGYANARARHPLSL